MNREIKFRAWDHKQNRMQSEWIGYLRFGKGRYPIMQFTGLSDKYNVDIYEGDIMAGGNSTEGRYNHVIEWDKTGTRFCARRVHGDVVCPVSMLYIQGKVIGNIYENPEMLDRLEEN